MRVRAIHQLHDNTISDDGIMASMCFIRGIFRASGYPSDIYGVSADACMPHDFMPCQSYDSHPDDLLLVHYSSGTGHCRSFQPSLGCKRLLIYRHVATTNVPEDMTPELEQLAQWASDGVFMGAITDSEYNAQTLRRLGYQSVEPVGPIVDLNRTRKLGYHAGLMKAEERGYNVLSLDGLSDFNNRVRLLRLIDRLRGSLQLPIRLLLVTAAADSAMVEAQLRETISWLDLDRNISILSTCTREDMFAFYRIADLYISTSRTEVPQIRLLEMMALDLPILAPATESSAITLARHGLLTEGATLRSVAAAAELLLQNRDLRAGIINDQRRLMARYERPVLINALESYFHKLGLEVTLTDSRGTWVVEGPFDSSYSLAIVNRELARALARTGTPVALHSQDGPGPFQPDKHFLSANPDVGKMLERGRNDYPPTVCLRNQYPPYVADMRGAIRVLANYAWEESGFPWELVQEFNASLELITAASSYVAKVLRDNGVRVPIHVVGHGVDHILRSGETIPIESCYDRSSFRFLHVSSGFRRKGIDVLLEAWGLAFTKHDPVELIIKTFPNANNTIEADYPDFCSNKPEFGHVSVINKDLSESAMYDLYMSSDALVCPTRGEGFGLPIAEAMALGKPVITTAYGGQTDFCTSDTAWLCDYSFAYARTHFGIFDSVWVEPDPQSLAEALREVFEADPLERLRRTEAGRADVRSRYNWDQVARRCRRAVATAGYSSYGYANAPRLGWVSTWNSRCGIAAYARSLASEIDRERLSVFATKTTELIDADETFVRRCWIQGWHDPLDELFLEICAANVDAIVLQFNFGFFELPALERLVRRLWELGTPVFAVLHSTMDVVRPDIIARLSDIAPAFAKVRRLLVHSVHDLNRLKGVGLVDNATLFPMGLPEPFAGDRAVMRRSLGLEDRTVITSFGYLLPHKGLRELISAFAFLRAQIPTAHLLMLNALYPVEESELERQACLEEIYRLGVQDHVTLVTDFLDEADVVARLAVADIIVYPYQNTQESASAAVKMGLGSLTPVAVTPLPLFADVDNICYRLPGTAATDIAEGLARLLAKPLRAADRADHQRDWTLAHSWKRISARLDGLIQGEMCAPHTS